MTIYKSTVYLCLSTVGYSVHGLYMQKKSTSCKDTKMATPLNFFQGHVSRPVNWYRFGFRIFTVRTAILRLHLSISFIPIVRYSLVFIRSSRYCLESVEKYSKRIIVSPKRGIENYVNTTYIRGNTRISPTEFVYDKRARDCKCLLKIFVLPA